ncbi:MAG: tryptophan synthase subunit alpha [Halanaerobiaceae bacterium]
MSEIVTDILNNQSNKDISSNDISNEKKLKNVFRKKALMPFITAGDPDLNTTKDIIITLDRSGADIIEIGIPFSDPLADGPVIQAAGLRSLKSGTNLAKIFEVLKSIKNKVNCPYLLMGYYNPILNYGKERFVNDAIDAGVSGVIIPDLPYDQDIEFFNELINKDIIPVLMLTPVTAEKRLKEIASLCRAFIYCVSLLGTTGTASSALVDINKYLNNIRKYTDIPLALGFGIDGPEKVKEIINDTDGIIIGSALVKIIEEHGKNSLLLKAIETFIKDIKAVM